MNQMLHALASIGLRTPLIDQMIKEEDEAPKKLSELHRRLQKAVAKDRAEREEREGFYEPDYDPCGIDDL